MKLSQNRRNGNPSTPLGIDGQLTDEPDCKRVAIELTLTGFNRCNDDKHRVQYPKPDQDRDAYKYDAKNRGNRVIDQHRDLEIERFLSVCVDLRRVAAFQEPNNERPENVTKKMKKQAE